MLHIRPARTTDLDELLALDREAFQTLRLELSGKDAPMPLREREYYEFWRRTDPQGALVAEENGTLVGLNMNHARGRGGWFGPLAVRPGAQGRGVGRRLLEAGLAYLESRGCETIGLDTFGPNAAAVGLYVKFGFAIVGANVMLEAPSAALPGRPAPPNLELAPLEAADVTAVVDIIEQQSGFSRRPDVEFHLAWEKACAFKLCDAPSGQLKGFALGMQKKGDGSIGPVYLDETLTPEEGGPLLLGACAEFFAQRGVTTLRAHAFGDDVRWLNTLFAQGFQIRTLMTRMIRSPSPACGGGVRGGGRRGLFTPLVSEKG